MKIIHDHPCEPYDLPGQLTPGPTFTYDCRCGKTMIVTGAGLLDEVVFGKVLLFNVGGQLLPPTGYIDPS